MTAREFSEVDHDLLADYVGGALGGTPEQDSVARLIGADPAWGDAYAELVRVMDLVHADLADWAAGPAPEMPATVADRITAALAGAGPARDDGVLRADAVEPTGVDSDPSGPAEVRHGLPAPVVPAQVTGGSRRVAGTTRPAEGPGGSTGPGRRVRRWARIATPVAVAAASITAVGLGLGNLVGGAGFSAEDAGTPAAAPQDAGSYRTTAPAVSSGTDYTPEQLSTRRATTHAGPSTVKGLSQSAPEGQPERLFASLELGRLAGPAALDACLTAIDAEHGYGPITIDLIDYASFQGQAALVVTFVDAGGARWAWVSGPECGLSGSGADTRFRTRVG